MQQIAFFQQHLQDRLKVSPEVLKNILNNINLVIEIIMQH